MGTHRKFIVEVVEAGNLMPKDGHGSVSPYVQVDFNNQRKNTQTALRNLNPVWNETLSFNEDSPADIRSSNLKLFSFLGLGSKPKLFSFLGRGSKPKFNVAVYHDKTVCKIHRSKFLGQIRLSPTQFVPKGEETLKYYQLKNPWRRTLLLKYIKDENEIGLKIYFVEEKVPPLPPRPQQPAPQPPQMKEVKPDDVTKAPQKSGTRPTAVPEIVEEPPAPKAEPPREGDKTKEETRAEESTASPPPPRAEKLPVPKPELPHPPARSQPPTEGSMNQVNPAPTATRNILRKIPDCKNLVGRIS